MSLDGTLTMLDEHYNNVKALDALNQELFQMQMGEKETVGVEVASVEAPPNSLDFIPGMLPTRSHS